MFIPGWSMGSPKVILLLKLLGLCVTCTIATANHCPITDPTGKIYHFYPVRLFVRMANSCTIKDMFCIFIIYGKDVFNRWHGYILRSLWDAGSLNVCDPSANCLLEYVLLIPSETLQPFTIGKFATVSFFFSQSGISDLAKPREIGRRFEEFWEISARQD